MSIEAAEEILELPQHYTKEDVRSAYTELARRYHPDAASKHHFDPAAAQELMVEANKANDVLKQLFVEDSNRVVTRGDGGIASGSLGVDWRAGWERYEQEADNLGDFADDLDAAPPAEKPPLSVRSVLLGPVVLRVVLIVLFAWLWWSIFPLLPHNLPRYVPAGVWKPFDIARLVAAMVYPTYLLVYESITGFVSGFVREVLNGIVSWITRKYVDLRPHSASYGCSLYKLVREQVYAVLMAPLVVYAIAACLAQESAPARIVLGIVAVLLAVDTLAACAHGGFVNVWATSLADRIEAQYLLLRARVLKRCGAWEG